MIVHVAERAAASGLGRVVVATDTDAVAEAVVAPGFEAYPYPDGVRFDPAAARQLLAQAGYPGGIDAGSFNVRPSVAA